MARNFYSEETKRRTLQEYADNGGDISKAAKVVGVPYQTVMNWVKKHRQEVNGESSVDAPKRMGKPMSIDERIAKCEREISNNERMLQDLRDRLTTLREEKQDELRNSADEKLQELIGAGVSVEQLMAMLKKVTK